MLVVLRRVLFSKSPFGISSRCSRPEGLTSLIVFSAFSTASLIAWPFQLSLLLLLFPFAATPSMPVRAVP